MASSLLTQIRRHRDQLATLRRMLDESRALARMLADAADKPDPTADQADELQRRDVRNERLEKSISEAGG